MQSFKDWVITKYYGKDTPRGDFAYDAKRDKHFPEEVVTRQKILDYLNSRFACDGCLKVFNRLWKDYCKETGYTE